MSNMTVMSNSTLSKRGKELAKAPNVRELYKNILLDPYDPDTNPNGFINIGVSENFAMLDEVAAFVNNKKIEIPKVDFSYGQGPWGTTRLRTALAKLMTKIFTAVEAIDPDDVLVANGVTSLCEMLGFTICDPGDAVLFPQPIYQAFKWDFGAKAGVKCIHADFDGEEDQFGIDAVTKYEEAIKKAELEGTRVRALMLCNPHNPLGQCYPRETIIALMKLCNKYKIHILSDEIYGASVYEVPDKHAKPFTSVLSFDHSQYIDPNYVHVLYGMSKDFGAGGLRLGCTVIRNKELMHTMSAITMFHWTGGPSQEIATRILEDEDYVHRFLQLSKRRLSERNILTRKLLDDAGIKYHRGANAGFFIWIDLRPYLPTGGNFEDKWDREKALIKKLMDHKVFITNGQELSSAEPGWFRVIFSQPEDILVTGMKRVFKAIGVEN